MKRTKRLDGPHSEVASGLVYHRVGVDLAILTAQSGAMKGHSFHKVAVVLSNDRDPA